jgi:predicted nucleotidyltransferase
VRIRLDSVRDGLAGVDLLGAWVFGSARDGEVRPGSDLDIAVLFAEKPSLDTLARCRASLQEALQFEDIDLVPLNGASPILRFEALQGIRVCCTDEDRCAEFASLTAREYEDEMAMCQRWLAAER